MVCFLDLGTSKVSGLLIDDLSNSKINAFSSIETSGVKKGSIINISATASSISKCLSDIEKQSGAKIKEVLVSISGEEVSSTNSIGQAAISEKEVSSKLSLKFTHADTNYMNSVLWAKKVVKIILDKKISKRTIVHYRFLQLASIFQ